MLAPLTIRLFLAVSSYVVTASAFYDNDCKFRANVSDIEELAQHKYQVLEDCLFYKLSQEADKMQQKANALTLLPPTVAAGETLDVDVLNVVVRQMWMNEVWKEMNINGYFLLSWKDRRMKWDQTDWKTDVLNVRSYGRLWVPDIHSDKHQTSAQSSDYTTYQNIVAKNTGNVSARLEYRLQAHCEIDYSDYPDDIKHCCFTLKSTLYPRYIKYYVVNDAVDLSHIRTNWHVASASVEQLPDEDDRKAQVLTMCVTAQRRSMTIRIELTIPMIISALLVLIAPFFGTFYQQLCVKLFAILLQFLCFQFLAGKTPQVGFGDTVPRIYIFYMFTMLSTILSLLITLLISAASRIRRKLPPAHRYTLLASVLNTNMCCASDGVAITDGTSSKDNYNDWLQIHVAINNLASIVVLIAYVIGAIIIAF